ncbi:MAG: DUF4300 family protein [Clostridia bacterium]
MKKRCYIELPFILIGALLLLAGCRKVNSNQLNVIPDKAATQVYSNLVTTVEQEEVKSMLQRASISGIDPFFEWVNDYNYTMGEKAGLVEVWTPLSKMKYQTDVMSTAWEQMHPEELDANCRLTAYLLMEQLIQTNPLSDYGTYLMMDVDEIENNDRYMTIKDHLENYIALFNQVSVADAKVDADYRNAFIKAWKERGVTFQTGDASLISVVMNDSYDKVLFIGHTGVLIEEDGYLLFIEKIAPCMPYQATRFANRNELAAVLLGRPEYTLGDEDFSTFLMENNRIL